MLMTGRLKPGQQMKIHDLTRAFGTSTQPVREAIRQLVAERALQAAPNRTAHVPAYDQARLLDLRAARLAVECLAVELAVPRATPADIATLEAIVLQQAEADARGDAEASVGANLSFHFTLYGIAGSSVLPALIENLWLQLGPYMRSARENFNPARGKGGKFHRDAIDGLKAKDVAKTRAAIEGDINRTFDLLLPPA
jgi:DNA-binding GntR family transcriptional regulator